MIITNIILIVLILYGIYILRLMNSNIVKIGIIIKTIHNYNVKKVNKNDRKR
jgi:hypothetical protein